jgi:hypothetical protein
MTEILKVPFNRSYWVVPGKLLAGCYPGSEDSIEEERNLKGLIQAGIRHVTVFFHITLLSILKLTED